MNAEIVVQGSGEAAAGGAMGERQRHRTPARPPNDFDLRRYMAGQSRPERSKQPCSLRNRGRADIGQIGRAGNRGSGIILARSPTQPGMAPAGRVRRQGVAPTWGGSNRLKRWAWCGFPGHMRIDCPVPNIDQSGNSDPCRDSQDLPNPSRDQRVKRTNP